MTDAATLATLRERVAALTSPDREVDRALGLAIDGWISRTDQWGPALEIHGSRYPDHPGSEYPALTESIDAAVALIEAVLPGQVSDILARALARMLHGEKPSSRLARRIIIEALNALSAQAGEAG